MSRRLGLEELLKVSPCLAIADELKEKFREIYKISKTINMGKRRFQK
jgi:hypothetical protein